MTQISEDKSLNPFSSPVWVVMGVCGCGKSEIGRRLAAALQIDFIEGDQFHPASNIEKMQAGIALTDSDRAGWLQILQQKIAAASQQQRGLVLSCSALKRRYRDLLREGHPALQFVHLHGDQSLIASRMQARQDHFMPLSLLDSQLADLEMLQANELGALYDIRQTPEQIVAAVIERLPDLSVVLPGAV